DDRLGRGLRAASPAGHRDGRRALAVAGADAIHHTRHLSRLRRSGPAVRRPSRRVEARAGDGVRASDDRRNGAAMNLSAPFIDRPVATTLLTLGIALAGAIAFRMLPVSPLPQVDYPTISI